MWFTQINAMTFLRAAIIALYCGSATFNHARADAKNGPVSIKVAWDASNYGIVDGEGKISAPSTEMAITGENAIKLWEELQSLLESNKIKIDEKMTKLIEAEKITFSPSPITVSAIFSDDTEQVVQVGESYVIDPMAKLYRGGKECMQLHEKLRKMLHFQKK